MSIPSDGADGVLSLVLFKFLLIFTGSEDGMIVGRDSNNPTASNLGVPKSAALAKSPIKSLKSLTSDRIYA